MDEEEQFMVAITSKSCPAHVAVRSEVRGYKKISLAGSLK